MKNSNNLTSTQSLNYIINTLQISSPYKILEFLKIIGKHKNSANYIKETDIGLLICGWSNKIIMYNDFTYDIENEVNIDNHNIFEINKGQKKEIELVICSNGSENIKRLIIQKDNNHLYKLIDIKDKKSLVCFQFNKDYIICNEKGIFQLNDISSNITQSKEIPITELSYWNGIKINESIVALTSNKVLNNGEDEIIFFNYYSKKIACSIKDYSFALSQNNLAIMSKEENKNKILLCACKKYKKGQKNGILLLKLDLEKNINYHKTFYNTKNYEVNCFYPIFEIDELSCIDTEKTKMNETDYFLVGGLNKDKQKALIKLYKVNYEKTEIEYIQDIKIEKIFNAESKGFKRFKRQINFISQSKKNGNIIADGKVILFTYPNISF